MSDEEEDIIDGELVEIPYDADADYERLTKELVECFPAISPNEINWARLKGSKRQTKAIIQWLVFNCGEVPVDIANRIDEPIQTVYNLLYEVVAENTDPGDIETVRRMELLKLDYLAKDVSASKEKSKAPAFEYREVIGKEGEIVTLTRCKPHEAGDPRWAALLLKIRDARAKLTGMDQPAKVSVTKDVRQIQVKLTEVSGRQEVSAPPANAGLLTDN